MSEHAGTGGDHGRRGRLVIRDAVVARIASLAANEVPGVATQSGALSRVMGRGLPRVESTVAGGHVRARVDVAARWGHSLPELTAAVRDRVHERLASLTGLVVDGVDVHVAAVVTDEVAPESRRVA
jgi:uncharacterized alkaline shock family protein YloU